MSNATFVSGIVSVYGWRTGSGAVAGAGVSTNPAASAATTSTPTGP